MSIGKVLSGLAVAAALLGANSAFAQPVTPRFTPPARPVIRFPVVIPPTATSNNGGCTFVITGNGSVVTAATGCTSLGASSGT